MSTKNPAPTVGKCYEWAGPRNTFYMGKCTKVEGARVHFDGGPAMLDDGRYRETEAPKQTPAHVYQTPEGLNA